MTDWSVRCSARRVELLTVVGITAVWLSVALGARIALPVNFPYQARHEVIDTAVVVVLLVPIVLAAQVLDERPASAVRTAARPLGAERLIWVSIFLAQSVMGALLVTALAPVPADLVLADSLLLSAGVVLGSVWLGPARGWGPVTVVVALASTPGLVPASANLFYVTSLLPVTGSAALASAALALSCYARAGCQARPRDEPVW